MSRAHFERLGQQLREDLQRHAEDEPAEARVRRQLLSRSAPRRQRATRLVWGLPAGAALVLLVSAFWLWPRHGEQPLRFWIEERSGQVDEWVTAREAEQSLRFSDGSSLVAGPHTTTRVTQVTPEGARLTLERGHLDAHVVHRESSRWQVAAGPFVVQVTGTRFRVRWDPLSETLAVRVSEGRVQISGGGQPEHELTAGSQLELRSGASLRSAFEAPSSEVALGEPLAVEPLPDEGARGAEVAGAPRKSERRGADWRELSTSGRYREALASVEEQGFAAHCETLGVRDLLTLGGTARLAGRSDRAREAYMAVRRRFPQSSEAAISAFSLGRLASDAGQAAQASSWFKRYLAEEPRGQLARETSGRLLELAGQQGDARATRLLAEAYLKQYPSGPHAALARSVLAHP